MNGISSNQPKEFPARFTDLKKELTKGKEEVIIKSWNELLEELAARNKVFSETGPEIIPQVDFASLGTLKPEEIARIRRVGSVVIRNVVDDDEALEYKADLKEYVKANPQVEGRVPDAKGNKQFFEMYWSKSQLRSRSHPNVVASGVFLNKLWDAKEDDVVNLDYNLVYADRFRIRQPSPNPWNMHAPHVDGAATERWEDAHLRSTYDTILNGDWKKYNPFSIGGRLIALTDKYGRENQSSIFRTWQGWLAMSEIAPGNGTIRFYPEVGLANSYIALRPFFTPVDLSLTGPDFLKPSNWKFDVSGPNLPGIGISDQGHFTGLRPTNASHPHLELDKAIVSVPRVKPGDMVFWHCDVIHSVENYHTGPDDSSVIYIPAVPLTPRNVQYVARQRDHFRQGMPGPDFPQGIGEVGFTNPGKESDISAPQGLLSMGMAEYAVKDDARAGAKEAVRQANELIGLA